jgi:hypothetical protein
MKKNKSIQCLMMLAVVSQMSILAGNAAPVVFSFDPNDLMDVFPSSVAAGVNKNGPDSRGLLGTGGDLSTLATTYTNPSGFGAASAQPDGYNAYRNWLDGLGANEGIMTFNIFMRGDFANVAAWGQTLKMAGDPVANSNLSGTAGGGWTVTTGQFSDPSWGYFVQWSAPDLASALRPGGLDFPTFSFTADVVVDPDGAGGGADGAVILGNTYTVWFGAGNNPGAHAVEFDENGWGTLPSSIGPWAAGDTTQWNGTLELTAAVPEPSTWALTAAGFALVGLVRKRKKRD